MHKRHFLRLKALPKDMPDYIEVDVTDLDFGKSVKVKDVPTGNYEVLDSDAISVAVIEIPRALRGKSDDEEGEEGEAETEEAAEA